jgi:hypothetical protein
MAYHIQSLSEKEKKKRKKKGSKREKNTDLRAWPRCYGLGI